MNALSPSLWGGLITLAGAILLYAASPNQRLLARRAPKPAAWAGLASLLAGAILLFTWAGPATAVYIVMTVAMLAWTLVPLAAAWLRKRKGKA